MGKMSAHGEHLKIHEPNLNSLNDNKGVIAYIKHLTHLQGEVGHPTGGTMLG